MYYVLSGGFKWLMITFWATQLLCQQIPAHYFLWRLLPHEKTQSTLTSKLWTHDSGCLPSSSPAFQAFTIWTEVGGIFKRHRKLPPSILLTGSKYRTFLQQRKVSRCLFCLGISWKFHLTWQILPCKVHIELLSCFTMCWSHIAAIFESKWVLCRAEQWMCPNVHKRNMPSINKEKHVIRVCSNTSVNTQIWWKICWRELRNTCDLHVFACWR